MDANSLSKKSFWELWGAKDMMWPLLGLWGHGLPPPPPGSASGYLTLDYL